MEWEIHYGTAPGWPQASVPEGGIAPFGPNKIKGGMAHTIPVPPELITEGKISLVLALEQPKERRSRIPTGKEVLSLMLVAQE